MDVGDAGAAYPVSPVAVFAVIADPRRAPGRRIDGLLLPPIETAYHS